MFQSLPSASGTFVCSNHFPLGRRTTENPNTDYPSIFMTVSDYLQKKSSKERRANKMQVAGPLRCLFFSVEECVDDGEQTHEEMETNTDFSVSDPMPYEQLTREMEVIVYTGLS